MSNIVTPAALLKDLDIDKMVDTTLAQNYFKKHNFEFWPVYSDQQCGKDFGLDNQNNKIYKLAKFISWPEIESRTPIDAKKLFSTIASEVESNAELFAQIAYLTRNAKTDDITKYDIKLIANQFRCLAYKTKRPLNTQSPGRPWKQICLYENVPLAFLAEVARCMFRDYPVIILYSLDCAALCHLFVELCFKAGCTTDELQCWYETVEPGTICKLRHVEGSSLGSVAVVTEKTNMDSAVSAVVDGTGDPKYPWRLSRVIVQECVYERFKRVLQSRVERQHLNTPPPPPPEHLITKADLLLVHDNHTFLIDFVGSMTDDEILRQSYVRIEAYRTTKELLSLLNVYQPSYLSLWCSDVSTSNEIAFGIKPCIVWLNDFGVFDEIGIYLMIDKARLNAFRTRNEQDKATPEITQGIQKLTKLRAEWIKKDVRYRTEVVRKVLNKYTIRDDSKQIERAKEVLKAISDWDGKPSFLHVENGRLCIGVYEPIGVLFIQEHDFLIEEILDIMKSVILGNGLLVGPDSMRKLNPLLSMCREEGVPIMGLERAFSFDGSNAHCGIDLHLDNAMPFTIVNVSDILYKKRVIFSHFGETFAN